MACRCCISVTPAVNTEATQVVLTPATAITKNNKERFCFRMASAVPTAGASLPVVITVNGTSASIYNKYGNPVIGSDLPTCKCKCLFAYYGVTDGVGHVSLPKFPITFNCSNAANLIG